MTAGEAGLEEEEEEEEDVLCPRKSSEGAQCASASGWMAAWGSADLHEEAV